MAKKTNTKVTEEPVIAPVVEETPAIEAPVVKKTVEVLGLLGDKKVTGSKKTLVNGKEVNLLACEDGTTYILSDEDVKKQLKSV